MESWVSEQVDSKRVESGKTNRVQIFDTTLRDGGQTAGITFSAEDKIRIAERLASFGVDYIEGGWPGASPKDDRFFELARERDWRHSKLVAFGST
ncbi:MAG TPA: citramalate synthase, partial [Zetaproteobacteria bacterium]|nr:citramalate synthase [Zetaproteobacteria bacterium]